LKLNQADKIEKMIGYQFKNKAILKQVFTHTSYANEHNIPSYERLEFLGDAVLEYIITTELYKRFPHLDEGKLTKARAYLVSCGYLSNKIKETSLIEFMLVGEGTIQNDMRLSHNMHCDLFEAIVGGILIDNDFDISKAREFILRFLKEDIIKAGTKGSFKDYKSLLLEMCAKKGKKAEFSLINKEKRLNEDFIVELSIEGKRVSVAHAKNKKEAEKKAAQAYFETLE
jgi:ribonuclease-3